MCADGLERFRNTLLKTRFQEYEIQTLQPLIGDLVDQTFKTVQKFVLPFPRFRERRIYHQFSTAFLVMRQTLDTPQSSIVIKMDD